MGHIIVSILPFCTCISISQFESRLIPTVFLPLSLLSYTSILGIVSTVLLVFVIMVDGFTKKDAPGSLWIPAETNVGVANFTHLGVAFGLFMAGVSIQPSKKTSLLIFTFASSSLGIPLYLHWPETWRIPLDSMK